MQGEGLKNFRTGGGLPIWGEAFLLGDQYLITYNVTFIYVMTLLIVQNFKKFFTADAELQQCAIFGPNMDHLPQFLCGKLLSFSSTCQLFALCKFLKNFFWKIQSYEDVQFLGPKRPISPNENFFRKPVNEPCFFHSCLSACQKLKSDINLLVKY